ncbi:MAG: glycosyltransferase [Elusimicrobia bacterium]|nr:glycosyltransferase [Elusimicrobiota bacterium]
MLSAVLTHYNCGRFLPDAVRSVLSQSEPPEEILVVDDGSTDDSRDRIKPFLDKVRWIEAAHGGQAAALNKVLPLCRGDWIAFLETDDVWDRGKLAAVAAALKAEPDLAAVQHGLMQADSELRPLPTPAPAEPMRWTLEDFLAGRTLLTGMSGLAVRREALQKLLPLAADITTAVDDYLQPRLLKLGPMRHLPGTLGLRRLHGANQYAGVRSDLKRLSAYLVVRGRLDAHREAFLRENSLALAREFQFRLERERAELEFFGRRLEGRFIEALADLVRVVSLCRTPGYAAFKALSLAAALVSPALYLSLYGFYERRRLAAATRKQP